MGESASMDVKQFLAQYVDHLVPKLDAYEQAIYLYAVRHSRAVGRFEVTIGFNAASRRGLFGLGNSGAGMSANNCRRKVQSLESKMCVNILSSQHDGFRMEVRLPGEIPGLVPSGTTAAEIDIEGLDFFVPRQNRELILEREGHRCFYCLRNLDQTNYVLEHVQPQEVGGNGYRNVIAACRECNNKKGSSDAEALLRQLYRSGLLTQDEFDRRLESLGKLRDGELRPDFDRAATT